MQVWATAKQGRSAHRWALAKHSLTILCIGLALQRTAPAKHVGPPHRNGKGMAGLVHCFAPHRHDSANLRTATAKRRRATQRQNKAKHRRGKGLA